MRQDDRGDQDTAIRTCRAVAPASRKALRLAADVVVPHEAAGAAMAASDWSAPAARAPARTGR